GATALVISREIRQSRQANLKDVLGFVPGVYVQPRFGAADESQISIRGSGLRNNFHARGVNLLVNGMPYRNADGFTDFESLELLTTETIEVYKGSNALRYGGSTLGGAINLHTRTGYTADRLEAFAQGGSFGFYKAQGASGGRTGGLDYYGSYARTSLDGYRDWSDQRRDRVNLHLGLLLAPGVDVRSFYFFARVREHLPGALTAARLAADPTAADSANRANRYGRDYDLHHLGLQLRARLSPSQRVELSPYFQYRDIDHPIFRVIAQQSRDYGVEARYENDGSIGGRRQRFVVGFQAAYLNMDNRQFDNIQGSHGQLRKDQKDEVTSVSLYAEETLAVLPKLSVIAGLRLDHSVRKATDHFLDDGNQSDRRTFEPVQPKLGVVYDLPAARGELFANVSRSYEPPLLLELNSLTVPGFINLRGQDAWQFELGTRGAAAGWRWDVSVYDIELRDEILNANVEPFPGAGFTVPTYRNAPRTRHYGLELGGSYAIPGPIFTAAGDVIAIRAAYTFARYRFVEDSVFDGNDIPGAPKHHLVTEVRYVHPAGLSIAPSLEWVPESYAVNSANTVSNRSWLTLGLRTEWTIGASGLTAFAAVQNLTNSHRSASVQVDNAAGKYFEPMDGRAVYAGVRWGK
ncbi:MAG: TonB-dependent receptor family protein, partial [Gemmatimonadales bacterium]